MRKVRTPKKQAINLTWKPYFLTKIFFTNMKTLNTRIAPYYLLKHSSCWTLKIYVIVVTWLFAQQAALLGNKTNFGSFVMCTHQNKEMQLKRWGLKRKPSNYFLLMWFLKLHSVQMPGTLLLVSGRYWEHRHPQTITVPRRTGNIQTRSGPYIRLNQHIR